MQNVAFTGGQEEAISIAPVSVIQFLLRLESVEIESEYNGA
jgi:hypothetical protein